MCRDRIKISEITGWLNRIGAEYTFKGNKDCSVNGFSSLLHYKTGTLTWIKNPNNFESFIKYGKSADQIACAVVEEDDNIEIPCMIKTKNSKALFFSILREFWGSTMNSGSIGAGTVISDNAWIDSTVIIGCNCSITGNIVIGKDTIIEHNVVIQGKVKIGSRCQIQSGAVIGIDGFGYSQELDTKQKTMVEHFGGVIIGDDVFVGSHVNIARGTIDDTTIGDRVKIAPSTHIGHNNIIGNDAAIICSTLYGSIHIGDRAYITASTIANQLMIGSDTVVGMGSVLTKPIGANVIAYGIPAEIKRENNSGL